MDTLSFTALPSEEEGKKEKARIRRSALTGDLPAALLLGISTFFLLCGMFGLRWTAGQAFSGSVTGGLVTAWNRMAAALGSSRFILLKTFAGEGETGLFLTLVLLAFIAVAWMVIRSRIRWMLLLFLVPEVLLILIGRLEASPFLLVLYVLSLLTAAADMRLSGSFWPGAAAAVLLGLILLLPGLTVGLNAVSDRPSAVAELGARVSGAAADAYYGTDPLGHGDLTRTERQTGTGEALSVTMSDPQSYYLKGFTGDRFQDGRWKTLSEAAWYQAEPLMRELRENGFDPISQLTEAAELVREDGQGPQAQTVQIVNTGADRRYAYIPYEFSAEGSLAGRPKQGGDRYCHGVFGRFYDYTYEASENLTSVWTDTAAGLFTSALAADREGGTDDVIAYLTRESHFNDFVYQNYTWLSDGDRRLLAEYIGAAQDLSEGHLNYKTAIRSVRAYLENNFIYTEDTGAADRPASEALRAFLETGKGYDVHYATAAVLMFRYYGIPARYAEGYLLTPEQAEAASAGESISVSRESAHAWAEIYIDGLGFVPLEVTPEYYGVMEEADLTVGISNESLMKEFQEAFGGSVSEEEEETVRQEGDSGRVWQVILILAAVVAGIFLLLLLIFLLRRLAENRREERLRREHFLLTPPKPGTAWIYADMVSRRWPVGEEIRDLGNRAAYSPQPIEEDERKMMLNAWTEFRRQEKEEKKQKSAGRQGRKRPAAGVLSLLLVICLLLPLASCSGGGSKASLPDRITSQEEIAAWQDQTAAAVLAAVPDPQTAAVGGEWALVGLKLSGTVLPENYYGRYEDNLRVTVKRTGGRISDVYPSENGRAVLGCLAAGLDYRDIEGFDLTEYLEEEQMVKEQGINAASFALTVSRTAGFVLDHEEEYLTWLAETLEEEGWYEKADLCDYVSIALEAYSFYRGRPEAEEAVEKGLALLKSAQLSDGSLGNCESTAEAILALTALGIDPLTDEDFIRNGHTLADGLLVFSRGNGEFCHKTDQEGNDAMATEKALLALDALALNREGRTIYEALGE